MGVFAYMYVCVLPLCLEAREGVIDSCEQEVPCGCQGQNLGAQKHSTTSFHYLHLQVAVSETGPMTPEYGHRALLCCL